MDVRDAGGRSSGGIGLPGAWRDRECEHGWSVVKTPDPAGKGSDDDNLLYRVSCVKASDCWAAGEADTGSVDDNEMLHWDGERWSHVLTPQPGTFSSEFPSPLVSVSCTSPNDCWAVGYYVNNAMTALFGMDRQEVVTRQHTATRRQPRRSRFVRGGLRRGSDC